MTVKAINNSNYTLRYIVFNEREKEDEKIHQKSNFKIRNSSNTIRKLFDWLTIKISWLMLDFSGEYYTVATKTFPSFLKL